MKLQLNRNYLFFAILIFSIEILIAVYLTTGFIRYTLGDYLVVILLFCFIKSFIEGDSFKIALGVLIFSFLIEFLQLLNILELLNIQHNHLLKLILGSTFHASDLLAYTLLGIITVIFFEYKIYKLWIT